MPVSLWLSWLHDGLLLANKMVNSDQSASPLSVNTDKRQISNPAQLIFSGPSGNWPLAALVFGRQRHNVATKHSATKRSFGSSWSALRDAGRDRSGWGTTAIEAIPAQSHRGDRELPSTTLWNRNIHYRPVQRHCCRVRNGSTVGAPGQRHRRRIRLSLTGEMVARPGRREVVRVQRGISKR